MRQRKADEPKKGAPAYMATYGDMMTLLLTFFVLLFAMSTVDAAKFKAFAGSFEGSMGILDGGNTLNENTNIIGNGVSQFPESKNKIDLEQTARQDLALSQIKEELEQYTSKEQIDNTIVIEKSGAEIIIRFDDMLLFDVGKADMKAGAIPILSQLGTKLADYLEQGYYIKCEGHTDNVPIRTTQFPSNWELSSARAISVARFFIEEMDFDPAMISAEGMGEYRPRADNTTAEGRSMNRRVEIKLSKSTM